MGQFQNKDLIVDVGELPGSSNNLEQVFHVPVTSLCWVNDCNMVYLKLMIANLITLASIYG